MSRVDWRIKLLSLFIVFVISMGYYANIATYDEQLGTKNILQVEKGQMTESSNDILMNLSFGPGAENLSWNAVQLSLEVDGKEFPCMVGGMSSIGQSNGTVQSKLNADGKTFTINVDATGEEMQSIDLFTMAEANGSTPSLTVQRTDIFLGSNTTGVAVGEDFSQVDYDSNLVFDESSEQRLEWYSYDLSVHRIIPDSETYIIEDRGVFFKVQLLSYYDSNDESRHITMLASTLNNATIPALVDDSMIQISACSIIENGDGVWSANEVISLQENELNICASTCSVEIRSMYQQKLIRGANQI